MSTDLSPPGTTPSVRIDKWLWSIRLFKTRSQAAAACGAGKVQISGQAVKPSRSVRPGDIVVVVHSEIIRTFRILESVDKRIGAKLVPRYVEDLTPASQYDRRKETNFPSFGARPKGSGRPTKKERRSLQRHFHDPLQSNDFRLLRSARVE